jgi:hypothetical protein
MKSIKALFLAMLLAFSPTCGMAIGEAGYQPVGQGPSAPFKWEPVNDAQQGRLTLSATSPYPTADVANATTVYYLPYTGDNIVFYDGIANGDYVIPSTGISLALTAAAQPAGAVYDVYFSLQSGVGTLCAMSWGGAASRSTSAGGAGAQNSSIALNLGIWTNNTAIASGNCFNNTTSYAIPQNQGALLGSFYASGNGAVTTLCKPAATAGGGQIILGLSNAYNRIEVNCTNRDSATAQTSASASWASLGGGDTIIFIDSLGLVPQSYAGHVVAGNGTAAGDCGSFGVAQGGGGTGTPNVFATTCAPTATLADNYQTLAVNEGFYPTLGFVEYFAEKQSATGTTTYMPTAGGEDLTFIAAY